MLSSMQVERYDETSYWAAPPYHQASFYTEHMSPSLFGHQLTQEIAVFKHSLF